MKLWLVRHAPVDAPPGLCYGRTDLPAQAEPTRHAAQTIAAQLPSGIALRSSPLQRCRTMAEAVAALRPDLAAPTVDDRLAEIDFGDWEGRRWDDIARADIDAWTADFVDAHAGRCGESTRQFMGRVGAAWDDCRAAQQPQVWFTHAGVIRALQLLQRGVRIPQSAADWPAAVVPHGEARVVDLST